MTTPRYCAAKHDEVSPRKPGDPPWRSRTAHRSCDPAAAAVLRAARLARGWSLSEAARRSGVSRRIINLLEAAERRPSNGTEQHGPGSDNRLRADRRPRLPVPDRHRARRLVTARGTRRGRDGKRYRAAPMSRQERGAVIRRAHHLVCEQGLSIRAAQAQMAEDGTRRSRGGIAADLANYECPACADRTPGHVDG